MMRMGVVEYSTDDRRWNALVGRDRGAVGAFVYAVRTTGVYCRPGCPSRTPNRENVAFFGDAPAAEKAGFRPCRRCRPTADDPRREVVITACRLIEGSETPPPLAALAEAAGLSPAYFQRVFKRALGVTPRAYAAACRERRLRKGLTPGRSVVEAMVGAGFGSTSRAYDGAAASLGMTPSRYKAGAAGVEVRYAVAASPIGWVLVATTERGLCAVEMDDDPAPLVARFRERFPAASALGDDREFAAHVARVVASIEDPGAPLDLPLDVRGTAFQRRVWEELRRIPSGSTATYAQVAARLGRPRAVRAVARACATNPVSLVVPCHRVVRTDGGLGDYRWGLARKRALLDRERRGRSDPSS